MKTIVKGGPFREVALYESYPSLISVQLLAGLQQQLKLVFHSGTQSYPEVTTLDLKPSPAMQVLTPASELVLPLATPHDSHEMSLLVRGEVPQKEKANITYMVREISIA